MRRFTWIALVLALVSLPALAQVRHGTVTGTVLDSQQQALPGVTVTLSGPFMQGTKTIVTDQEGKFRFMPVPPGQDYTLKFELTGFNIIERGGITVSLGRDIHIDAEMAPSQFAETITVAADRIVIDTSKSTVDTTVEWELLDTQSTQRHFNAIWYMTPGVPVAGQNNPSVRGAGGDDNAILIDGVDTTDPRTQTWGTQINWDTIQEAQVQTGGYLAEYGRATGGIMNLITKSGGNDFSFTARAVWRDSEWAADPGFDEERGITKTGLVQETEMRPNFTLGGPFLRDRLWFYVGNEWRDRERTYSYYANSDDMLAGNPTPIISNYKGRQASAKLTWQVTPNHSLVGYYNEDPIDITNVTAIAGSTVYYAASAMNTQYQGGNNYSLQWYGVLSPNFFMEAKYQLHQQELNQEPMGSAFGTSPRFYDRTYGYYSGEALSTYQSKRDRDGLLLTGSWFLDTGGGSSHQLKAGVEYLRMQPGAGSFYNPAGQFQTTNLTRPARRYVYLDQDPLIENEDTYYALFLQDQWTIGKLTLNLGLRAEQITLNNNLGAEQVKFGFGDQFAPRLGFAWDLNGNSLHGSISRFYDLPTGYISAYMSENPGHYQRWNWVGGAGCPSDASDPNWWQAPESCWTMQFDVPLFGGGYEVDPNLDPIHMDEITLGYDHLLSEQFAIGANLIWREQKNSIEDLDPEYDGIYLWGNGPVKHVVVEDGRVFDTDDPWKEYQGLELTLRKRMGADGFQFLASYNYTFKNKGWIGTGGTSQSNSYSQFSGYGDAPDSFDSLWYGEIQSPHLVKFFGSWTAPWKMTVGLSTWWTSGNLYTRTVPGDSGTVPLEEYGSSEVGDNWEADLHIEQAVKLGPVNVAVYADVFSVFDNQQPTARGGNSASSATYTKPTGWQSPRQFAFGLKIEY